MKRKILFALSIATLVTNSAFAMEISKGKLLSHKEWTSQDATAQFHSGNQFEQMMPMNFLAQKNKTTKNEFNVMLHAMMGNSTVASGEISNISGKISVLVQNTSQETKKFTYAFELCADTDTHRTRCAYVEDEFQLDPDGYVNYFNEPVLQTVFKTPGNYSTFTYAQISTSFNPDGAPGHHILSSSIAESSVEVKGDKA